MYIHNLPNEIKELIFKEVYEHQCYEVVMSHKPMSTFFHMLWFYNNPLARCIIWKWLIWYTQPILYPENVRWIKSQVYDDVYKFVHKAHQLMYGDKNTNPLAIDKEWYNIEKFIPPRLKARLKRQNISQITKEILLLHQGKSPEINNAQKQQLIRNLRDYFSHSSFIQMCCDWCGLGDGIITYPCKHRCCIRCFESKVYRHCEVCDIVGCSVRLKRKGWNYYISKYLKHINLSRCRNCGWRIHQRYGDKCPKC